MTSCLEIQEEGRLGLQGLLIELLLGLGCLRVQEGQLLRARPRSREAHRLRRHSCSSVTQQTDRAWQRQCRIAASCALLISYAEAAYVSDLRREEYSSHTVVRTCRGTGWYIAIVEVTAC
jgi:hypothetical protein